MKYKHLASVLVLSAVLFGCKPVKQYQKQFINDAEMDLSAKKSQKFETNFQAYREGASGAGGGKTGGGCGCN
ncbi:MAG TPA: DUF4266 domain-containing protein [Chitinophagaceae bacterium]